MNTSPFESLSAYWYIWAVGTLLAAISAGFLLRFVRPARAIAGRLAAALEALAMMRARSGVAAIELEEIARRAMNGAGLPHLWREYADTLHAQAGPDGKTPRWRATTLAETFFSEQALVDTPLKTEFYKHLPGILTGLGIIGTFTGLIIGLINFDVSLDPSQAQAQLARLISAVGHAFVVSAAAITLAMLFTWIEKSLITGLYRQVEELHQAIDGFFAAGAGEEYLERMVVASESTAHQVAEFRSVLLGELRALAADFSARQSSQAREQGQQFESQTERVHQLLGQTSAAMNGSAERFAQLTATMEQAGRSTAEMMSASLTAAVAAIAARAERAAESGEAQLARISRQAEESVGGLSRQMDRLLEHSGEASQHLHESAATMAQVTVDAIRGMNAGADTLYLAATDFAKAGSGVAATVGAAGQAAANIETAAQTLALVSASSQELLAGCAQSQAAFAHMVGELKDTIANARREASLTADLVDRLQAASAQLAVAQRQSEDYLRGVSEVLTRSHQSFAENIERTLREANRQFHKELAQAVGLLSGAIKDLGDTIDELPSRS